MRTVQCCQLARVVPHSSAAAACSSAAWQYLLACSPTTYFYLGLQDVKALIARVFRLQTEISRLKADVQKLGSARDTQELRQRVGQSGQRLKGDAQQINQDLQQAHKAKKTQQTTKIVADFEVLLRGVLAAPWKQTSQPAHP